MLFLHRTLSQAIENDQDQKNSDISPAFQLFVIKIVAQELYSSDHAKSCELYLVGSAIKSINEKNEPVLTGENDVDLLVEADDLISVRSWFNGLSLEGSAIAERLLRIKAVDTADFQAQMLEQTIPDPEKDSHAGCLEVLDQGNASFAPSIE